MKGEVSSLKCSLFRHVQIATLPHPNTGYNKMAISAKDMMTLFVLSSTSFLHFCVPVSGFMRFDGFTKASIEKDKFFALTTDLEGYPGVRSEITCALACSYEFGYTECLAFSYNKTAAGSSTCLCGLVDFDSMVFNPGLTVLWIKKECMKYQYGKKD